MVGRQALSDRPAVASRAHCPPGHGLAVPLPTGQLKSFFIRTDRGTCDRKLVVDQLLALRPSRGCLAVHQQPAAPVTGLPPTEYDVTGRLQGDYEGEDCEDDNRHE